MKTPVFLVVVFICLLISCKRNYEAGNKKALDQLEKRYPDIYKNHSTDKYKVVRTLIDENIHAEFELLIDSVSSQEIMIVSNAAGAVHAIPLPANDYSVYWNFYKEPTKNITPDTAKTFANEMKIAFKMLGINGWNYYKILEDITPATVRWIPVSHTDTAYFNRVTVTSRRIADSCDQIQHRNYIEMLSGTRDWRCHLFEDHLHDRLFQFQMIKMPKNAVQYNIEVFREPCVIQPIYL